MVITTPALVRGHIGTDMCVCARRRRCNQARQKSTNNGRHETVGGKTSRDTADWQAGKARLRLASPTVGFARVTKVAQQ